MYLSRLNLPLADRQTQELLASPYELHRALMEALPTPAGRMLFRIEPPGRHASAAVVLVQSEDEPDWDNAALPRPTTVEMKAFDPQLPQGTCLRFRLRANPTARRKIDGAAEGKRVGLTTEEDQRAWLARKGEQAGFRPDGVIVIDEGQIKAAKPNGHASPSAPSASRACWKSRNRTASGRHCWPASAAARPSASASSVSREHDR